ncbi:MAG: hypothetical protein ACFCU1_01230 [Sumerlaeia bacterium]
MNWLFPFSWKETTDPNNPWSRLLTPKPIRLYYQYPKIGRSVVIALPIILLYLGYLSVIQWYDGDADSLHRFYDSFYVLTVFLAFIAAGLGSKARLLIEFSPLLQESFSTPLKERDYFAAMHRYILFTTFLALLAPIIFALLLSSSFFWTTPEYLEKLTKTNSMLLPFESIAFKPYGFLSGYRFYLMEGNPWIKYLFSIAAIINIISWGFGFYLHALVLGQISHHKRNARFEGAIMTIALVVIIMLLYLIRFAILPAIFIQSRGITMTGYGLMSYIMVVELIVIAFRILAIRLVWFRMFKQGFKYSRLKFFGE